MKFRYKEYCAGTFFLLYRKLLSCKVKNTRGCAKAHSLFYERKKKRKTGESEPKNVMDYRTCCWIWRCLRGYPDAKRGRDVSGGRYSLRDPAEIESEDRVQVLVMMTGFATLDDPTMDSLTVVRRIQSHGTNLEKIDQVNQISREFCNDELTLEQAFKQMKALWKEEKNRQRYGCWHLPF